MTEGIFSDYQQNINLENIVLVYSDGISFKGIDMRVFEYNPIIYDKFFENNIYYDISITHCPYSYCSCIYFGKFTLDGYKNGNIIILDENNNKVQQLSGLSEDDPTLYYRRIDTAIMTLRNLFTLYPDHKFINYDNTQKSIFDKNLKIKFNTDLNNIHPKTFIYGIEYLSTKTGTKKYAALFSKYSSEKLENNFNITDTGYHKYFKKLIKQLKKKIAIVTPCFWYVWKEFYPNTKIINI